MAGNCLQLAHDSDKNFCNTIGRQWAMQIAFAHRYSPSASSLRAQKLNDFVVPLTFERKQPSQQVHHSKDMSLRRLAAAAAAAAR